MTTGRPKRENRVLLKMIWLARRGPVVLKQLGTLRPQKLQMQQSLATIQISSIVKDLIYR